MKEGRTGGRRKKQRGGEGRKEGERKVFDLSLNRSSML